MVYAGLLAVTSAALLPLGSPAVHAADPVSAEQLLPNEVLGFFSIPSVPDLKNRWSQSLWGRMAEDESFTEFLQEVERAKEQISSQLEDQTGLTLEELWELPSGQVTLALIDRAPEPFGLVGVLEYGDRQETVDAILEKMDAGLMEKGATKDSREIDGTEVTIYTLPQEEVEGEDAVPGEEAPPNKLAYALRDSHLIIGNGAEVIEPVLARWNGDGGQTFASHDVYKHVLQKTSGEEGKPLLKWYVDPIGLVQAAVNAVQVENPQAQLALAFLPTLGLDRFRGIGGTMEMATGDYDSVSRTYGYVHLPATGLLRAFQLPATELAPPAWVSKDATSYMGLNWNVAGAYKAIESLYDMLQGPGGFARMMDQLAQQPGGPQLHPRKDLIDQLTGKIHIVGDYAQPDDATTARMLFAAELKDPAKMEATLSKIAKTPGFPGKSRDFRGQAIYEIPPLGADPEAASMGAAVANDHLMIAADITLLEQVLRGDNARQPLSGDVRYQQIARHFPKQVSMIGFEVQDVQFQTVYEMLRSGQAEEALAGEEGEEPALKIDFSKLPPFSEIKEYIRPKGSYIETDDNGFRFVSFTLKEKAKSR